MKIFSQLFWLFLFSAIGTGLSILIEPFVAIPGSVIGMVLFFFALHFKWIKMEQVDEVATWISANMAIFFVPSGVGLMAQFGLLKDIWWQLIIIMFVATALMMIFVGRLVQYLMPKFNNKSNEEEEA